jgi:hypothetical protein
MILLNIMSMNDGRGAFRRGLRRAALIEAGGFNKKVYKKM